jgi:hypothetical protein
MYKKTIDFDKIDFLPFYFAKFVSSNNLFVVSFGSSKYKIKSSENKNNVSSSFPNWIPFILFPYTYFFWLKFQVICWVTVVTCLNLEEMHWFFPIWYDASCGFVALTIIILSYYVENSLFNILSWQYIEIYERFFCMYHDDNVNFLLILFTCCIKFIDLRMLNSLQIPGMKATSSGCMIFLVCCWNLFGCILPSICIKYIVVLFWCCSYQLNDMWSELWMLICQCSCINCIKWATLVRVADYRRDCGCGNIHTGPVYFTSCCDPQCSQIYNFY